VFSWVQLEVYNRTMYLFVMFIYCKSTKSDFLFKWVISKTDAHKIDALDQWCLRMLLGIKWYQFVRNDDVRRLTKQPKLTAVIQSHRLTLFGHIMSMDDNADAKRILLVSPPADWRRQLGYLRITWISTIQQDLKHHHRTLPEAADLALWRMMSTYGATQSWVACQKRRSGDNNILLWQFDVVAINAFLGSETNGHLRQWFKPVS